MSLTWFLSAWILIAGAGMQSAPNSSNAFTLGVLFGLESVWNSAHLTGDAAALNRLWGDDLVVTVPGMPPMYKAEAMQVWRSGEMRFQKYETSEVHASVFGETGIVTGRLRRSRSLGGQIAEDDWRFTKVYIWLDERWQVVAFHASPSGL